MHHVHKTNKSTHGKNNACTRDDDLNFIERVNGDEYNEWLLSYFVHL